MKLLTSILSEVKATRTRLYYFPNGLKSALFDTCLQVQFHEISLISHASTKNVFTGVKLARDLLFCILSANILG